MVDVGKRIRGLRVYLGYSQEYVADQLGIDQGNYSRMESGKLKISTARLQELASILMVTPADILNWSPIVNKVTEPNEGFNVGANYNETLGNVELEGLKKEIERLRALLAEKDERLKDKDEIISLLRAKK